MMSIEQLLRDGPGDPSAPDLEALARRAEADELVDVAWTTTDSPVGELLLAATPAGLVRVSFTSEHEDADEVLEALAARLSPRVLALRSRLDPVRRQLDEYFAGRRDQFDVAVDWSLSHGFRRRALGVLADEVGFGQVVTYKELAERTGSPRAVRAAGSACATNPIPIVVPCHRVVRTGGGLGGYGGGLDAKRLLLTLEGSLLT
ncbi:MAG: methylated-DNA--[protein]-cysteine S-methyltransferase [Acidimicrobiales bacterium]